MSDRWRDSYDAWKTADGDDPGRLTRLRPAPWYCTQCPVSGRGLATFVSHEDASQHRLAWGHGAHRVTTELDKAAAVPDPDPAAETMASDGSGRR